MEKFKLLAALILGASPLISRADTFTLKDGSVVEGSILSETADAYVIEVQVTKSIKDERTISKSEVVKIVREQLDRTAFEALSKMANTPDFSTSADYSARLAAINKFITDFPQSIKVFDAKKILEKLKAEAAQIEAGGIKYNGLIITKEDYLANAYDLDSRALSARIRDAISKNEVNSALRSFSELDRDFPGTEAHTEMVPIISNLIKNYLAEVNDYLSSIEVRLKERKSGLDRMALADRKETEAAVLEEDAAIEKRYLAEKAAKVDWLTISPNHQASLTDTVQYGGLELKRLGSLPILSGPDAGKAYRDAYTAVKGSADDAAKTAALAAAKTAGVSPRYLAPLEADAKPKP